MRLLALSSALVSPLAATAASAAEAIETARVPGIIQKAATTGQAIELWVAAAAALLVLLFVAMLDADDGLEDLPAKP